MEKLTFSPADFPASLIPLQESEKEKMTSATCGPKCLEQLEKFPRVSLWEKMFAASLIGMEGWYSRRCALSWKLLGIKSRPLLYLRAASVRHTEEKECGLLPTPMAQSRETTPEQTIERQKKYGGKTRAMYLENFAVMGMLPTPRASEYKGTGPIGSKSHKHMLKKDYLCAVIQNKTGKTSQLNPRFVAEMMGFPPDWTELPFLSGDQNL